MVMNLEVNMKKWMNEAKQEGRIEGRKKGFEEGLYVAAKALIQSGKSIEETSNLLNLPQNVVDRIKNEQ